MPDDVVTRLYGNAGVFRTDVVTRLRGRTNTNRVDVVTRLRGGSVASFTVGFAPPMKSTANPFEVIALTVAPSLPADSVTVTQTAGPTVPLLGSGLDRSAKMPALLTGSTLTFQATATKAGYTAAIANYSITVAAHGGLYRKNGQGVEWRTYQAMTPGTSPAYSDTYLDGYETASPGALPTYSDIYTETY